MKTCLKVTDLPIIERPTEKLIRYGPSVLSNSELLAVIIRTGTKEQRVIELCSFILSEFNGLYGLMDASFEELIALRGIGKVKGAKILAILELHKRFSSFKGVENKKISSPKDAAFYVMNEMRYLKQEVLKVIYLNTKNVVISLSEVSKGSVDSSIVHPREVFKEAIKKNSSSIIICHNHPSGDPTPSGEDISVTKRLEQCGKIIGINLIDHIIIGDGTYISLKFPVSF